MSFNGIPSKYECYRAEIHVIAFDFQFDEINKQLVAYRCCISFILGYYLWVFWLHYICLHFFTELIVIYIYFLIYKKTHYKPIYPLLYALLV